MLMCRRAGIARSRTNTLLGERATLSGMQGPMAGQPPALPPVHLTRSARPHGTCHQSTRIRAQQCGRFWRMPAGVQELLRGHCAGGSGGQVGGHPKRQREFAHHVSPRDLAISLRERSIEPPPKRAPVRTKKGRSSKRPFRQPASEIRSCSSGAHIKTVR